MRSLDTNICIASIATAHAYALVTRNNGEFARVPALRFEVWARRLSA